MPRKPIRLARAGNNEIHCIAVDTPAQDLAPALRGCADQQRDSQLQLCGYILKKDSPSCGMERVKIWDEVMPVREGVGIFAAQLMQNLPYLPVEEEGRLGDAILRENFIQRVFAMRRWHLLLAVGLTVVGLIEFHARHKLIIMSHDQASYRTLGQLVAQTTRENLAASADSYLLLFMRALKVRAMRGNHVNVLQHIQGYLKTNLDADDKQELVQSIADYRLGLLPLIVPITLLNHYFRKHPSSYIANSWYMKPYPAELSLQNTI